MNFQWLTTMAVVAQLPIPGPALLSIEEKRDGIEARTVSI